MYIVSALAGMPMTDLLMVENVLKQEKNPSWNLMEGI